jgi:hypothetical protein
VFVPVSDIGVVDDHVHSPLAERPANLGKKQAACDEFLASRMHLD